MDFVKISEINQCIVQFSFERYDLRKYSANSWIDPCITSVEIMRLPGTNYQGSPNISHILLTFIIFKSLGGVFNQPATPSDISHRACYIYLYHLKDAGVIWNMPNDKMFVKILPILDCH